MQNQQERQFSEGEIRRRFGYVAPSGQAIERHQDVRALLLDLAHDLNELLPDGREKALAFTKLEEVGFHSHSAIARNPELHDQVSS